MNVKLCSVSADAANRLPRFTDDKSGIGVHYVDAFLKPMNAVLPGGPTVKCKRRGLKVVLAVGDRKGEGLLRRLEVGPDPVAMLRAALEEAAHAAGVKLTIDGGEVFVDIEQITADEGAAAGQ
jgi:hypothetical protein